jgi:hypothetical protein
MVPFAPILRNEVQNRAWYKKSRVPCVGTPMPSRIRLMSSTKRRPPWSKLTVAYLAVLESVSARFDCLRSSHWSVGKASGETISRFAWLPSNTFARWHWEL